ncbi:hypothetical protein MASR2M8_20980 [Opitutaceae bacterium]
MTLRKSIFWLHLAAGLVAGVVILIMSVTGVALAYEKEIVAWAERDAQRVTVPAGATRLPVEELIAKARAAQPDAQPASVIIKADPEAAVALSMGRAGAIYVDPYTGDVRKPEPTAWRPFMSAMVSWHRYIALSGDNRALGKAITGACNAAFLVLGITGLYLWWPRTWSKRALAAITTMKFDLRGKARDFNWHNSIGLWSAIPIIIMTATALPISYQWAGNFLNKLNGPSATPAAGSGPGAATPAVTVPPPPAGAQRLGYQTLLSSVQQQMPDWKQITLNLGGAGTGGGRGGAATQPGSGSQSGGFQPVTFSVREASTWPRTATTTLNLNPFTGETLRREGYDDLPLGRQIRAWTRFLHTGEALGPIGQGIAGLGSLGGVVLVWTGFSLSWRRFFGRRENANAAENEASSEALSAKSE